MIKAVVFDFGGVLVRTRSREGRNKWDDLMGLPHGSAEHIVFNSEMGQAAQRGEISEDERWRLVAERFGLDDARMAGFVSDFWAGDYLDEVVIDWIRNNRERVQMAIISNAMDGLRHDLKEKWGILDDFDVVVVSAEFGTMKPHPTIYQHCLDQLSVEPQDAVFVDDFAHNIAGAEAVGMHGIHYPPTMMNSKLITQLDSYLT